MILEKIIDSAKMQNWQVMLDSASDFAVSVHKSRALLASFHESLENLRAVRAKLTPQTVPALERVYAEMNKRFRVWHEDFNKFGGRNTADVQTMINLLARCTTTDLSSQLLMLENLQRQVHELDKRHDKANDPHQVERVEKELIAKRKMLERAIEERIGVKPSTDVLVELTRAIDKRLHDAKNAADTLIVQLQRKQYDGLPRTLKNLTDFAR